MTTALDFIATLPDISDRALDMLDASGYANLTVLWNPRLRTTAGRCHYVRRDGRVVASKIDLNPSLKVEGVAAIRNTFLHELAHAIAGHAVKHGTGWKATHKALGGNATRCHEYASMSAQARQNTRKVVGHCDRCDQKIVRAKALPANRTYRHPKCGGTIIKHC
jgi:predicted SprT family Zn-dependent metalloprotease